MVGGSIEPSIFGGPEGSLVKVELSEDSLGLGRAVEGVAREARKGPEGLLDRADRFYQLKETILPVHTAKRDAKALEIRVAAVRSAAEALQDLSPSSLAAVQMLIADYGRRFQNIDSTIKLAMPMIEPLASPEDIDDDWLGFAFEYIGGVSDDVVQELWAKLLAQEANHPGRVSKRAITKLALLDRRGTYLLRKVLRSAITLYRQSPDPKRSDQGQPLYKIGRFAFPLLLEWVEWDGPKLSDDLLRAFDHSRDTPSGGSSSRVDWLIEEGFLRPVTQDQFRDGYLDADHWGMEWSHGDRPLGIRVGLGSINACDARDLIEFVRRYATGGATTQIVQLTGLAEALLDPRITSTNPISEVSSDETGMDHRDTIEKLLIDELSLTSVPHHKSGIAENPGFLGGKQRGNRNDLVFYYGEF
ncbi:MAG: DUF2806 domain-containing protein [Actinobacteria bacterium]|nr:DUF2806 domain-containing protein [Actinomycetota bacterium]